MNPIRPVMLLLLLCAFYNSAAAGAWELAYARIEKPSLELEEPVAIEDSTGHCLDTAPADMECEIVG